MLKGKENRRKRRADFAPGTNPSFVGPLPGPDDASGCDLKVTRSLGNALSASHFGTRTRWPAGHGCLGVQFTAALERTRGYIYDSWLLAAMCSLQQRFSHTVNVSIGTTKITLKRAMTANVRYHYL